MKLLTVAVPAYNIESYIRECLDSLINDSLEVLVVNDGSSDNTEAIALEYQHKHPDIFRVITKPNGGWGSAINLAIKEAKGEYFTNLDSDDWYDAKGLAALIKNLSEHKTDALFVPGFEYSMKTGREWPLQFPGNCEYEKELLFDEIASKADYFFTVHSLVVRTALLQNNGVSIDECFYSDLELLSYPLPYVNTAFIQREPLYIYRVDREGQSVSAASRAKHLGDLERVTNSMVIWFNSQSGPRMQYYSKITATAIYAWLTYPFVLSRDKQCEFIPRLRAFKADVIDSNPNLSDYSLYGIFGSMVLRSDFNNYPMAAALSRLAMRFRGLSAKIWSLFR